MGRYPDCTADQREVDFFVEVRDDASCQHTQLSDLPDANQGRSVTTAVSLDTMPDTGVIASEDSESNVVEEYVSLNVLCHMAVALRRTLPPGFPATIMALRDGVHNTMSKKTHVKKMYVPSVSLDNWQMVNKAQLVTVLRSSTLIRVT